MLKTVLVFISVFLCVSGAKGGSLNPVKPDSSARPTSVMYVFEGSDWCASCLRFKNKVLNDSAFRAALDSAYTRMELLDFPQRKKLTEQTVSYNNEMAEKLGFNGNFPTIVVYSLKNNKFRTLNYRNEEAPEFLQVLLSELKSLNE